MELEWFGDKVMPACKRQLRSQEHHRENVTLASSQVRDVGAAMTFNAELAFNAVVLKGIID